MQSYTTTVIDSFVYSFYVFYVCFVHVLMFMMFCFCNPRLAGSPRQLAIAGVSQTVHRFRVYCFATPRLEHNRDSSIVQVSVKIAVDRSFSH